MRNALILKCIGSTSVNQFRSHFSSYLRKLHFTADIIWTAWTHDLRFRHREGLADVFISLIHEAVYELLLSQYPRYEAKRQAHVCVKGNQAMEKKDGLKEERKRNWSKAQMDSSVLLLECPLNEICNGNTKDEIFGRLWKQRLGRRALSSQRKKNVEAKNKRNEEVSSPSLRRPKWNCKFRTFRFCLMFENEVINIYRLERLESQPFP